jgi:hypothetical protein
MKNKLSDLRNHLFEAIEQLKDGEMEIAKAQAIGDLAQVVINSAKVEVDYLKVTDSRAGSDFIEHSPARPRLIK